MQRRRYAGVFAAVLSIFVAVGLTGCGGTKEDLDVTNLQIDAEGMVTHTMIEDFDTSMYNVAELEAMIQEEIADYGNEFQKEAVSLTSAVMSETDTNKVIVVMQFADADAYSEFNGIELFFGTIAEAEEHGYELDQMVFTDVSDKTKTTTLSELSTDTGHILIMNEKIPVNLPYKVLYTSGNVQLLDKYTVSGTEQSEGTEAEQNDGWIYVITK